MTPHVANKLRDLPLGKRQDLLLRYSSLSDKQPDQHAPKALDAAAEGGGEAA